MDAPKLTRRPRPETPNDPRGSLRILLGLVKPFREFFQTQAAGGIALMTSTALALFLANSPSGPAYQAALKAPIALSFGEHVVSLPALLWVNDLLMTLFFFLAGMEIKRELVSGDLNTLKKASLPLIAALGGMLVPAAIHFSINHGGPAADGWGIPMATDIAFALGCVQLIAKRVPASLIVFLMALAIFDDLGAILVIAVFYGGVVHWGALLASGALSLVLFGLARAKVRVLTPYLIGGALLWLAVHASGIHATVAGVILGLTIPAEPSRKPKEVLEDLSLALRELRHRTERELEVGAPIRAIERHLESTEAPINRLAHGLSRPVAFGVVPIFALANAGVPLGEGTGEVLFQGASIGVFLGLFVGKPLGVFGATWLAIRAGMGARPTGSTYRQLFGVSVLAGIGFTMSIFVATLAFTAPALTEASKVGILAGSLLSAVVGMTILATSPQPKAATIDHGEDEPWMDLPPAAVGFRVETWPAPPSFFGKTLVELELGSRHHVTVLGTLGPATPTREGAPAVQGLQALDARTPIEEGTVLVIGGTEERVARVLELPFIETDASPEVPSEPGAKDGDEPVVTST